MTKLVIKTNENESMSIEEIEDDSVGGKNITNEDEECVTSNFTTIVLKPRHSNDVP